MFRRLVILSTIALTLAGTTAMAQKVRQRAGGRRADAGQRIEKLQQRLNLSETQMSQIRALQETRQKEIQSMRQGVREKRQTPQETRESRREINQRFLSNIKGLLTPEQLQKLPKRFQ